MIVDGFLQIIYYFIFIITAPIRLLPDAQLPAIFIDALTQAKILANVITPFIPLDTLGVILGLAISFEVGYNGYRLVMWSLKRLPTQS